MQGKTFLTAVYCCVRCILYPGTFIVLTSKTRSQAVNVLKKITDILMPNSGNLRMEVEEWQMNQSKAFMSFRNGSRIEVVTAGEGGRGARAHIIIVDEFRLVDLEIIDAIIKRFLGPERSPGFLNKPEYKNYPKDRNKEMYLSSAWYQSHWSYKKAKAFFNKMVKDAEPYFVCALPYQVSIQAGLLNAAQVAEQMSDDDFNDVLWMMEMEALFYEDTEGALFTFDDLTSNRRLRTTWYPPEIVASFPALKRPRPPELAKNERRILSADIALLASRHHENDAASIWLNSALPNSQGKYVANMVYSENHEGLHTSDLALRIRKLYEQYHCTDIVLDVRGVGIGVYDALCRDIYDPSTGITYPPLSCCNDPLFAERCTDLSAPKVIWAVQASAQFNNDMYLALREGFKQHRINLLIDSIDFKEQMGDNKAYTSMETNDQMTIKMPYIDTDLLVNEIINLRCEVRGTVMKVTERPGMRKDRVSSVGYNYYVMQQIERKFRTAAESFDWNNFVSFRAPERTHRRRW